MQRKNIKNEVESLCSAAKNGDIATLKRLIEKKVDIDARDSKGKTALMLAAKAGHVEIVDLLINNNATIDLIHNHHTALGYATMKYHTAIVERLLKAGGNVNQTCGPDDNTLLHIASCNADIVKLLLDNHAKTDFVNSERCTALSVATEEKEVEVVRLLIEAGADASIPGFYGNTPLQYAALDGSLDIVKIIVSDPKARKTIDLIDNSDYTALFAAAKKGHINIVDLLLQSGADVNKNNGDSPLTIASKKGHTAIVKQLLTAGANINHISSDDGSTPLHRACFFGRTSIVELLLEKQANTDLTNALGQTALHIALQRNNLEIANLLLKFNPNVNIFDQRGYVPLYEAASNGNLEMMAILYPKTNDSVKFQRCLLIASNQGHYKVLHELLKLLPKDKLSEFMISASPLGSLLYLAACRDENLEAIKLLLAKGAEFHETDHARDDFKSREARVNPIKLAVAVDQAAKKEVSALTHDASSRFFSQHESRTFNIDLASVVQAYTINQPVTAQEVMTERTDSPYKTNPVAVDVTNSPTEAETLAGAMLNTDIDDPNAIDMQAPHVDATHKRPDSEPDTNARKRRGI